MNELHPPIAAPLGAVTTERLLLRPFERGDLDALASVFAHPEVWEFPYGRAFGRDETAAFLDRQIAHWERSAFGCWAARERADDRLVGYVGLSVPTFLPEILPAVEVGWRFEPSVWGRGYATEGATAALDEAFGTLGLDVVCSLPQSENPRSGRVAARLGMRLLGEVRIAADAERGAVTAEHWEIGRDEWRARR